MCSVRRRARAFTLCQWLRIPAAVAVETRAYLKALGDVWPHAKWTSHRELSEALFDEKERTEFLLGDLARIRREVEDEQAHIYAAALATYADVLTANGIALEIDGVKS